MNSTLLSLALLVVLLVFSMKMLAEKEIGKTVVCWTLVGVTMGVCKSLLIQMMPQWMDTPVDSLTYQLHAQALYLHWAGLPVDAQDYRLAGFLNNWAHSANPAWLGSDKMPYAGVFGTHEWIFSGLLALWQLSGNSLSSAIIANAILTGAFPAAAYIITRELGGSFKVCQLAALLVALDPSIAVNSAWLLKDTLAALLSMVVIISACQLCNKASVKFACILAVSLGLLAAVKYVAFIAFCLVFGALTLYFILKKSRASAAAIASASIVAVMIWGMLYVLPVQLQPTKLATTVTTTLHAQTTTLAASENDAGADTSVIGWRAYLHDEPATAIARAIARTLLAPYPWVAVTHGLEGNNQIELYMLATIFWIIALPGTLLGLIVMATRNVKALMLVALLGIITAAYIVFFGEWSTRQRVFLMPLMYSFSAFGWHWLWGMGARPRFRNALV